MMQAKVGPTTPPGTGCSASPPTYRSISSTELYTDLRPDQLASLISWGGAAIEERGGRPHLVLTLLYPGIPWSLPLCILVLTRSWPVPSLDSLLQKRRRLSWSDMCRSAFMQGCSVRPSSSLTYPCPWSLKANLLSP